MRLCYSIYFPSFCSGKVSDIFFRTYSIFFYPSFISLFTPFSLSIILPSVNFRWLGVVYKASELNSIENIGVWTSSSISFCSFSLFINNIRDACTLFSDIWFVYKLLNFFVQIFRLFIVFYLRCNWFLDLLDSYFSNYLFPNSFGSYAALKLKFSSNYFESLY